MVLLFLSLLPFVTAHATHGAEFGNVPTLCFQAEGIVTNFNSSSLPNPFVFWNGTRVKSKSDWACRREEIRASIQRHEQGDKPPKPELFKHKFSESALTITAGFGGKSIEFKVTIRKPAGKTGVTGAFMTTQGMSTIPTPDGLATIILPVDIIASQATRGQGVFYDLYGKSHRASALVAWAWAASRVIDALEADSSIGIDPKRIAVTGCSRYGKGALVVGAFDDRIALTIPQESGCGGAGCWRIAQALKDSGRHVETASNLAGTDWVASSFSQYSESATALGRLPIDHHELAGLIAPRGLYATSGDTDWLGESSPFQCMTATRQIFSALGVGDHVGFSQRKGHPHCQFPSAEDPEVDAFVQKFLLGRAETPTDFFTNDQGYIFNSIWTPYTVPRMA